MTGTGPAGQPENALLVMERVKKLWPESVRFSHHALEQMRARHIDANDIANAIEGGFVRDPRWANGEWRYTVEGPAVDGGRIGRVIAFEEGVVVVTVIRYRRRG